jgi:molecular chaperone HscB
VSAPSQRACPGCGAELETPIACAACGRLLAAADGVTPFAVLGLEPAARADAEDLRRRLLRFSRLVHPDFFGAAGSEQRALAERNTALLNEAWRVVSDDAVRADWLVRHLGGPGEADERQMPQAFLMEVLEWNEALEEARGAPAGEPLPAALEGLADRWRRERRAALDQALARLDPLPKRGAPALTDARRSLNAVRYLDRALGELEALRLARAAS